jgi:hypothetical protein
MQALHSIAALKAVPGPQLTYAKFLYGSGLGWQIRDYRGRKLVMHGGSTGTAIGLVPEEKRHCSKDTGPLYHAALAL